VKETRNPYNILVEKPQGMGPQRLLRHRCADNVKLVLKCLCSEHKNWLRTQSSGGLLWLCCWSSSLYSWKK